MNVRSALSLGLAAGVGYLLAGMKPSPPSAPDLPPPVLIRSAPLDEGAFTRVVERALARALDEPAVFGDSEPPEAAPAPREPLLVEAEGDGLATGDDLVSRGDATCSRTATCPSAWTAPVDARRWLSVWPPPTSDGLITCRGSGSVGS